MIWLTGDTHRDFDRVFDFCADNGTTPDDVLIILGDAGINFFSTKGITSLKRNYRLWRSRCSAYTAITRNARL